MRGGDVTAAARWGGACARWRQLAAEAAQTAVCRRRARGGSSHGKRGARDSPGAAVTTYNEQHDDRRRRAGRRVHQYVEYEYQTVPIATPPSQFLVPKSCATSCTCCTQAQNITNNSVAVEPVSQLATKSH